MAMGLHFSRYMNVDQFARELGSLEAYRGELAGNVPESLEEARLVSPHTRIRYPDPIARRMWLERHDGYKIGGPIEADGTRWHLAIELSKALYRWSNHRVYGPSNHPLEDLDPRFLEFIQRPTELPFEPRLSTRVDV